MYVRPNFKTKKALKEAVTAGKEVIVFSPGPFPAAIKGLGLLDGTQSIEGPHYPEPHKWYARVEVKKSLVVRVVS